MQSAARVGVGADKRQRGASLLCHGDGQTRGLSLHAGLQPELDLIGLQTHQSD